MTTLAIVPQATTPSNLSEIIRRTHKARTSIPYELGWPISAAAAADNPFFHLEPGLRARVEDDDSGIILQIDQSGDLHISFQGKPRAKCFTSQVFLV